MFLREISVHKIHKILQSLLQQIAYHLFRHVGPHAYTSRI